MTPAIQTLDHLPADAVRAIEQGLSAHRDHVVPGLFQALACLARDDDDDAGVLLGGATGQTSGTVAELRLLWVQDRLRGSGLGRALVEAFEAEARQRGCRHLIVNTLSFQARGFYERLGFRVDRVQAGYGAGVTRIWLSKSLV